MGFYTYDTNKRGDVIKRNVPELEPLIAAYVDTLLWTELTLQNKDRLDETFESAGYTRYDIEPETMAGIIKDCEHFKRFNWADLDCDNYAGGGMDFALTRNGHGAGFWDRGYPEDVAQRLTQYAKEEGPYNLYLGDDGLIYGT